MIVDPTPDLEGVGGVLAGFAGFVGEVVEQLCGRVSECGNGRNTPPSRPSVGDSFGSVL
ncbi:hypothetical protein [Halobiforma nitratireducens]|uniref:hypothetical protein n=1 Tax=Halobiforma nitratireducens TaxID=130048 RepID=UPI00135F181B|nr:hypothetical protein [Halobiforma nitratireducens]